MLALSLRGMGERLGFVVGDAQAAGFGSSVGQWPAFPDSGDALRRLQERFKLAVITNCDDDLFAQSERRLGVSFDYVITAQQAGSYKPDHANFLLAFERIDEPRDRILHVAQSLFHDHVPAKALGMKSVWIDRRQGRGGGASIEVEAHPDATFPSMVAFADDACRPDRYRCRALVPWERGRLSGRGPNGCASARRSRQQRLHELLVRGSARRQGASTGAQDRRRRRRSAG